MMQKFLLFWKDLIPIVKPKVQKIRKRVSAKVFAQIAFYVIPLALLAVMFVSMLIIYIYDMKTYGHLPMSISRMIFLEDWYAFADMAASAVMFCYPLFLIISFIACSVFTTQEYHKTRAVTIKVIGYYALSWMCLLPMILTPLFLKVGYHHWAREFVTRELPYLWAINVVLMIFFIFHWRFISVKTASFILPENKRKK